MDGLPLSRDALLEGVQGSVKIARVVTQLGLKLAQVLEEVVKSSVVVKCSELTKVMEVQLRQNLGSD